MRWVVFLKADNRAKAEFVFVWWTLWRLWFFSYPVTTSASAIRPIKNRTTLTPMVSDPNWAPSVFGEHVRICATKLLALFQRKLWARIQTDSSSPLIACGHLSLSSDRRESVTGNSLAGTPGRRALGREIQRAERIERVKVCEEVDLFYFVKYDAGRIDSKAEASLLLPMILNHIKVKQERNRSNTMSLRLRHQVLKALAGLRPMDLQALWPWGEPEAAQSTTRTRNRDVIRHEQKDLLGHHFTFKPSDCFTGTSLQFVL